MADAMMAWPELRNPFDARPLHADGETTVLYQGRSVTLAETASGDGLLVRTEDLPRINGFEVKPEGACLGDMCVPLRDGLLVNRDGRDWLDLLAFADALQQPWVGDTQARVWSFAEIPAHRQNTLQDAMVPDIEVTDRAGNVVRFADLKGKKALIVTWSSW